MGNLKWYNDQKDIQWKATIKLRSYCNSSDYMERQLNRASLNDNNNNNDNNDNNNENNNINNNNDINIPNNCNDDNYECNIIYQS